VNLLEFKNPWPPKLLRMCVFYIILQFYHNLSYVFACDESNLQNPNLEMLVMPIWPMEIAIKYAGTPEVLADFPIASTI
jgi:hypothetical protein